MYINILNDYFYGLIQSFKIHLVIKLIWKNKKYFKLINKIIIYNILVYIIPYLLVTILNLYTNIYIYFLFHFFNYIVDFFSIFFHLVHYIELINIVSSHIGKPINNISLLNNLTSIIILFIYQFVMYLFANIINFMFNEKLNFIAIMLNFMILTIYHSFYCYNNLWQHNNVELFLRIDIHEKLWPYYSGYGTLSTLIYIYTKYSYINAIYNIYLAILITIPFLIPIKFPDKEQKYPKIKLTIIPYMISIIIKLISFFK